MGNTITDLARQLRKKQTPAEKKLWELLRNRKFHRVKFFRQFPLIYLRSGRTYFFIADFYSAEKKLVIELDGKIHDQQKEYDENRDLILQEKGLAVIRFKNEELQDEKTVLKQIEKYL